MFPFRLAVFKELTCRDNTSPGAILYHIWHNKVVLSALLELFFPKHCVGCKEFGKYFCDSCLQNIFQGELICPICYKQALGGQTHPICIRKYGLDGLWSLGLFENALRRAIIDLKYHFVRALSDELLNLVLVYWVRYQPFILDQIKRDHGRNWLVVPVPLHKSRLNWRGFNQSELLAKKLATSLNLKFMPVLERVRSTTPQVKLKGESRRQNIRQAFALKSDCKLSPETCVLLIDDVWTTGSTLKECCYELKRAGAKRVWAITLAR